jgi:hypothetical protein
MNLFSFVCPSLATMSHLGIPRDFVIVKYLAQSINGRKAGDYELIPCGWFIVFGKRCPIRKESEVKFMYPDPHQYEAHTIIHLKGKKNALPPKYKRLECSAVAVDFASMSVFVCLF